MLKLGETPSPWSIQNWDWEPRLLLPRVLGFNLENFHCERNMGYKNETVNQHGRFQAIIAMILEVHNVGWGS